MYQQRQIGEVGGKASRAASSADKAHARLVQLEDKLDSLALTCQALWELVRESTELSDEMITAKVMEIDLRDGVKDNAMGTTGRRCAGCDRAIGKRHIKCMYCGHAIKKEHTFQP